MRNELYVSKEVKEIGYQLIKELNLNNGFGLSRYLSVNHCYNNHEALLIWIESLYGEKGVVFELNEIKEMLFSIFPESMFVY